MTRILPILFLSLWACGGPQELPPGGGGNPKLDPCDKGAPGAEMDTDGDLLSDACEDKLGTPKDDPDCDDDGITDRYDEAADCNGGGGGDPDPCDAKCKKDRDEARKGRLRALLADPNFYRALVLGSSALSQRAQGSEYVFVEKQQLAFGNIMNISHVDFQSRLKAKLPTLHDTTSCQKENSIFFLSNGEVDHEPSGLEMCGEVATGGFPTDFSSRANANNSILTRWTKGFIHSRAGDKAVDWRIFDTVVEPNGSRSQNFTQLLVKSPYAGKPDQYKRLDFELQSVYHYYVSRTEMPEQDRDVVLEEINRKWRRIDSQTDPIKTKNFLGFWVSCGSADLECLR